MIVDRVELPDVISTVAVGFNRTAVNALPPALAEIVVLEEVAAAMEDVASGERPILIARDGQIFAPVLRSGQVARVGPVRPRPNLLRVPGVATVAVKRDAVARELGELVVADYVAARLEEERPRARGPQCFWLLWSQFWLTKKVLQE